MGRNEDRKKRDLELLAKSHRALQAEQNGEVPPAKLPEPDPPYRQAERNARADDVEPDDDDGNTMMYRGRPVRMGSSGTPGAGASTGKPRQFRGAGAGKKKKGNRRSTDGDSLKAALAKLAELHEEGLITRAEFDSKRRQILDRL